MASTNPPKIRAFVYLILTSQILAEVPFTSMTFSTAMNRNGSFSGTLPMSHPHARVFRPTTSADETIPNMHPVRTGIVVEMDGELIWEGVIWTVEVNTAQQTMRVSAEGCFSLFDQQLIAQDFAMFPAGGPASTAVAGYLLAGHMSHTQRAVDNIGLYFDIVTDGGVLPDGYEAFFYEYRSVANEIQTLASAWDTGFDFLVKPTWEPCVDDNNDQYGDVKKTFYMGGRHLGSDTGDLLSLSAHFKDFTYNIDGKRLATLVVVIGEGEGYNMMTAPGGSPEWPHFYPQIRTVARKTIWRQNQLLDLAIAEAQKTKWPLGVPRLQLVPGAEKPQHAVDLDAQPWRYQNIYTPGDVLRVDAKYAGVDIQAFSDDSLFRVIGWTVSCDDNGNYVTNLDVAPNGVFDE